VRTLIGILDRTLGRLDRSAVLALSLIGVVVVGWVDYLGGYELAFSIFYLGPVAIATWYSGRRHAVLVSIASCVSWYVADVTAGHEYSHPAIPLWNTSVRLSFFLITGLLLAALRESLIAQRHLARTDSLTGLFSRRAFEERLGHDLDLARRRRTPLSIAFVDMDDFKSVNDRQGHAEGDRVLKAVGRALKSSVREADTAARLGGDEFALVLPDTDGDGARKVIDKVGSAVAEAFRASGCAMNCSIGVVTVLHPAVTAESALSAADSLMYEVKRRGKGAVEFRVIDEADEARSAIDLRGGQR
jgi:diguanylate cyclase (GGDEF)-like protein